MNGVFSLQLIDDLRRELDYLQLFKMEMEHPGQGKSLSRTRETEMEHEVKRLKQVFFFSPLSFPKGLGHKCSITIYFILYNNMFQMPI